MYLKLREAFGKYHIIIYNNRFNVLGVVTSEACMVSFESSGVDYVIIYSKL